MDATLPRASAPRSCTLNTPPHLQRELVVAFVQLLVLVRCHIDQGVQHGRLRWLAALLLVDGVCQRSLQVQDDGFYNRGRDMAEDTVSARPAPPCASKRNETKRTQWNRGATLHVGLHSLGHVVNGRLQVLARQLARMLQRSEERVWKKKRMRI